MQPSRFLECLAADASALRKAAARDLAAPVPSCPGWSVIDLVRHAAEVYLHKAECMRRNAFPDPWPPDFSKEEPLALFDRAYDDLSAEFGRRAPTEQAATWYEPDQTVGFWIRRMAQETVIHRVDAQLAANATIDEMPDDLAVDGVDEVLVCFLAYAASALPGADDLAGLPDEVRAVVERFVGLLEECGGRAIRVDAGSRSRLVRIRADGIDVGDVSDSPEATISGKPDDVLLWLWGRVGDDVITQDGDRALIARLRSLLVIATQ